MSTSRSATPTGIPFVKADDEDRETLWVLREYLVERQTPVTKYAALIAGLEEDDPSFDVTSLKQILELNEARLASVKNHVVNHPLVRLYNKFNGEDTFEQLCMADAGYIDIDMDELGPKHWTEFVKDYFKVKHDLNGWEPSIASTETSEDRRGRKSAERYAKAWRETEIARRQEEQMSSEEKRFREAHLRRQAAILENERQRRLNRRKKAIEKLEGAAREAIWHEKLCIDPKPRKEPTRAKPTTDAPGISGADRDYPLNTGLWRTMPPLPPAVSRVRQDQQDEKRGRRSPSPSEGGWRGGSGRDRTPTGHDRRDRSVD